MDQEIKPVIYEKKVVRHEIKLVHDGINLVGNGFFPVGHGIQPAADGKIPVRFGQLPVPDPVGRAINPVRGASSGLGGETADFRRVSDEFGPHFSPEFVGSAGLQPALRHGMPKAGHRPALRPAGDSNRTTIRICCGWSSTQPRSVTRSAYRSGGEKCGLARISHHQFDAETACWLKC